VRRHTAGVEASPGTRMTSGPCPRVSTAMRSEVKPWARAEAGAASQRKRIRTDLSMASRPIKEKEVTQAKANGIEPKEYVVARDGIALIVNPDNPIDELSLEQLMKIFTGAVDNWKTLGGNDEGIVVLSRESSSGTYVFFQEHVLQKKDYAVTALLMPATSSVVQNVSQDKASIGYVGLGYALEAGDRVKIVKVKTGPDAEPVAPAEDTVKSGAYPISRPLHLYSDGTPTENVQVFLDFCLGPKGQEIVREAGYVTAE